tara:strand:+ start:448 stop:672 length:225 start_codon:yes stop_codon:yes gene_type:complete
VKTSSTAFRATSLSYHSLELPFSSIIVFFSANYAAKMSDFLGELLVLIVSGTSARSVYSPSSSSFIASTELSFL